MFPVSFISSRNVIAESADDINAAVNGLSKNGFINYYGLQVQETCFKSLLFLCYCVMCSSSFCFLCLLRNVFLFVILHNIIVCSIVFASALAAVLYLPTLLVLLCSEENGDMLLA
jgi:hypothetical protein